MRTSEEIYHRVRWDARLDPARFVLGVRRRGAGPTRVPLPAFVPGGDIPWHRVLFFEADGEVVWDRESGVDRVGESPAGRVRVPRRLRAPFFSARTPHVWHPGEGWVPAADAAGDAGAPGELPPSVRPLRLVTWNTLWDRYDAERIDTALRRPLLLAELGAADADVIALQEVEPALLAMLLAAPWVRAGYTVGTDPAGKDVEECGLLLLSRLPVSEAGHHALGPHKGVAALTVHTARGPLVVAATHLTSDHSARGDERRRRELAAIGTGLAAIDGPVALLGDFNDGREGAPGPGGVLGMADAWTQARPGAGPPAPTFDPRANPLAAISSLTGRAGRLDRILLRGPDLRATEASLLGTVPTAEGLFASDHYGVLAEVEYGAGPLPGPGEQETAGPVSAGAPAAGAGEPGGSAGPGPVVDPGAEEEARARSIAARVREVLGEGVVEVVGSRRMGCALPGADVDLVAALPGAPDTAEVTARIAAGLPGAVRLREVTGARVPGLRFGLDGLAVDLALVATGTLPPSHAVARRAEAGEAAAVALSAVTDADAVRAAVGDAHPAFALLARQVKAWARARGLDAAPFGGLPGLAWSVLAARTVAELPARPAPVDQPLALLREFFAHWAAWDWREPVALGEPPAGIAESGPFTVLTPTAPVRSCTRQVGAGGRDLVGEELYRGWEILAAAAERAGDPWADLLAPPRLHLQHRSWLVLDVRAGGPGEFEPLMGRVRGRLLALLTALREAGAPDARAWPRPFAADPQRARYAIGLGRTPPPAHTLAEIATAWARGLPTTTLTVTPTVPTLR